MQQIQIGNATLPLIEYRSQPVLTFAMIEKLHGRPKRSAHRNFTKNRHRFIEDEDFFIVTLQDADEFLSYGITIPRHGMVILTERGYLLLIKSMKDDIAWEVQRSLDGMLFTRLGLLMRLENDAPDIKTIITDALDMGEVALDKMLANLVVLLNIKKLSEPASGEREVKITREIEAQVKALKTYGMRPGKIHKLLGISFSAVTLLAQDKYPFSASERDRPPVTSGQMLAGMINGGAQ